MKYTPHNLQKIEKILHEATYVLRYERGSFQSGYCIVEEKKVVILNKFLEFLEYYQYLINSKIKLK